MNRVSYVRLGLALAVMSSLFSAPRVAFSRASYNESEVLQLVRRLEERCETFRKDVDHRLDTSSLDNTQREDEFNKQVGQLYNAADRLHDDYERHHNHNDTRNNVVNTRQQALQVRSLMRNLKALQTQNLRNQWASIRSTLNRLCSIYGVPQI